MASIDSGTVLVVDPDLMRRLVFRNQLSSMKLKFSLQASSRDALALLFEMKKNNVPLPFLAFIDVSCRPIGIYQLLLKMKERVPEVCVVVIGPYGPCFVVDRIFMYLAGAELYVVKPFEEGQVGFLVRKYQSSGEGQ